MRAWRIAVLGVAFTMTWALFATSPEAHASGNAQGDGKRLRVRLTNELGLTPVKIGSAYIALLSPNAVRPRSRSPC